MALYVGQFSLTGELLSKTVAPLLLKRYRFLNELSFEVGNRAIIAGVSGRHTMISFKGTVSAFLQQFDFKPSLYRAVLKLSVDLQPRMLNPLIWGLLIKNLDGRPGITLSGERLYLELNRLPLFSSVEEKLGIDFPLSLFLVATGQQDCAEGILFNLYMNTD